MTTTTTTPVHTDNDPRHQVGCFWLTMRDDLTGLWYAAVSLDAAGRICTRAKASTDLAPYVQRLVMALAEQLGRMPVEFDMPEPDPRVPISWGRGMNLVSGSMLSGLVARQRMHGWAVRGWLDAELVEPDASGTMLKADRAILDVWGAYLPDKGKWWEKRARKRWATYDKAGPIAWPDDDLGVTSEADTKRLAALWAEWLDAAVLLKQLVKAAEETAAEARAAARHRGPAVIRPVAAHILATTVQQVEMPLADRVPVATIDGHRWATIAPEHAGALSLLGTRPGQRLIRSLTLTAHKQWLDQHPDPRVVTIDGGIAGLTDQFGKLRVEGGFIGLLDAGQSLKIELANETWGGLWTYRATRGGGRATGLVEVTLGTVLMPTAVHELGKRAPAPDKRLVPVLSHDVPVGVLDAAKHGAVYRAHYGLLVALVDGAQQIDRLGGVRLTLDDWAKIVRRAGLPSDTRAQLVETWLAGDDETCPLLTRDGDVFRLADKHSEAWEFIVEGGARRNANQQRARKGAANRQGGRKGTTKRQT